MKQHAIEICHTNSNSCCRTRLAIKNWHNQNDYTALRSTHCALYNQALRKTGHTRKIAGSLLFIFCGIIVSRLSPSKHFIFWIGWGTLQGIIFMITYLLLGRYNLHAIIIATSTFIITQLAQQAAFNAFPDALFAIVMLAT